MRRDFLSGFWSVFGDGRAPISFPSLLGGLCALASIAVGSLWVAFVLWYVARLGQAWL
jgi:hypothetical protein